jgi:hypothetical protein
MLLRPLMFICSFVEAMHYKKAVRLSVAAMYMYLCICNVAVRYIFLLTLWIFCVLTDKMDDFDIYMQICYTFQ